MAKPKDRSAGGGRGRRKATSAAGGPPTPAEDLASEVRGELLAARDPAAAEILPHRAPLRPRPHRERAVVEESWERTEEPPESEPDLISKMIGEVMEQSNAAPQEESETAAEAARTKARLEHRVDVDGEVRENFQQNFEERRRFEREAELRRQQEFAVSWRGRLSSWRFSGWLFNRETRHLELLILVGAGIAVLGVAHSTLQSTREIQSKEENVVVQPEVLGMSAGEELLFGREESQRVIRRFFQAKTQEDIMPWVRHADVLQPIMDRWYANREHRQESFIEFGKVKLKRSAGSRYYLHYVQFQNDVDPRPIAVEETPDGFLVDWETAVGYQAVDWEAFQKERPTEPVYLRLRVFPDNYYNFEFQDEKKWACYRLSHPDLEQSFYGYVLRHSPIDYRLRPTNPDVPEYFILKVRHPEGAKSGELLLIEEILQKWWVMGYEPGAKHFDER